MLAISPFGYFGDYALICVMFLSLTLHAWFFLRFFPKKEHPRVSLVCGNILIFACLLGFAGLMAESYLRFVSVGTDSFGMSLPARRWFALHTQLNSLGCRDVEWSRGDPAKVHRIAFVGDSFAYGWGITRVDDRFTERLQGMFDRRAPGAVEVLNVAKPGWDTGQQIQPIRDMIEVYGVDEIVLCHVPNDIERLLPTTPDFDPTRPPESTWLNPEFSCLADYLYRSIIVPRIDTVRGYNDWLAAGYADSHTWRAQTRRFAAIIETCRSHGVSLRVVLLPFIRTGKGSFQSTQVHNKVSAFWEQSGIQVVDLLPAITDLDPNDLVVNSHDAHPNETAHKLYAEAIWKVLYASSTR